ncbi:hypothetical protein DUNSADRAFT_10903 [Dunaliella salina]|uniref:Uncharacterized protein n=1 Tax=Dunaliella salina TaxID=3046 RepID=A0ABQ7H4Q5_DUNSA|nr:hypothetical protein DUNSADRAFT_10903 [Dunaliella salina]|eukprot:KAF5841840.1 hypothetical protein DUNSADRAFT_10903 [Dunaliella salina]
MKEKLPYLQAGKGLTKRPSKPTLDTAGGGLDAAQRVQAAHQAHQLYYCVLQHVLQKLNPLSEVTEGRFQRYVIHDPEEAHRMLRTPDFHLGLLSCSLELVSATVFQHHVPLSIPAEIGFESSMLSIWDAAGWFLDCVGQEGRPGRPSMSASG